MPLRETRKTPEGSWGLSDQEVAVDVALDSPDKVSSTGLIGLLWARPAVQIMTFAVLMALAAQVRIPVPGTHVPMTLQSLVMLLAGFLLAPRIAGGAMFLYLVSGTVFTGLFAGTMGIFGPTGGYLVGFVAASVAIAAIRGRSLSIVRLSEAGLLGLLILFVAGTAWNAAWLGSWKLALATGVLPFIAKALVQLIMAITLCRILGNAGHSRRA